MEGPVAGRSVSRRAILGGLTLGAVGAAAACTSPPSGPVPTAGSASTEAVAAPSPSPPATSSTTATPTGPRLPLVLAVHATRDELEWRTSEILGAVADGSLKVDIGGRYPIAEAKAAYDALAGRQTTGKLLLIP